jgi:hypothetical protein
LGIFRAARRRAWTQLTAAASDEGVTAAAEREIDAFLTPLHAFAHGRELPRAVIDLYRLVVVPRLFVNAEASRRLDAALSRIPAFATLEAGESLRTWFIVTLVNAIDAGLARARPSLKRPLPAGDEWTIVGVNEDFVWHVPVEGPSWAGHYYLLEVPRAPMTRAFRRTAAEKMAKLDESLQALSRGTRTEIVRQAGSSLAELVVRDAPLIARARA